MLNFATGRQLRVPRGRIHRADVDGITVQVEMGLAGPCRVTEILVASTGFAQQEVGVVAAMQQRVAHVCRDIVDIEVERNLSIVPDRDSLAKFQASDGKGKKLLDGSFAGCSLDL